MSKDAGIRVMQEREQWEAEYRAGAWDRLHEGREFAHYACVAAIVERGPHPYSLLDIGCGEGVMLRHLRLEDVSRYGGVDLAQAALDRIAPRRAQDEYICSSLEDYRPDGHWDVILFNEVLYYTSDPVAAMVRFEEALAPGGRFVVSMHRKRSPFAWNNCCIRRVCAHFRRTGYEILSAFELAALETREAWRIFEVRPPAGPSRES